MTSRKVVAKRSTKPAVKVDPGLRKYGNFRSRAALAASLNAVMESHRVGMDGTYQAWDGLTYVQRKALTEIVDGISRVLNGNANEPQHWGRIARYAELAIETLPQPVGE